MDSFIAVLNEINTSMGTSYITECLHQFYCDVTTLKNEDELVAAYQTVMTLKDSSPTPEHPLFTHVRKAIIDQMQVEIFKFTPESGCRASLVDRFKRVTGEEFKESTPDE